MEPEAPVIGLCADCLHRRSVRSARGSSFVLCQLGAQAGPRAQGLAKYPRLPVLTCVGYAAADEVRD